MNIFPYHILVVVASVILSCVHCEPMFRAMRQIVRPVNHEKGSVLGDKMRQFIRPVIHEKHTVLVDKREHFPRISRPIRQEEYYRRDEKNLAQEVHSEELQPIREEDRDRREIPTERLRKTSVVLDHAPVRNTRSHQQTQPSIQTRTQSPTESAEKTQPTEKTKIQSTETERKIGLPEKKCPKFTKKQKSKFSIRKLFGPDLELKRLMCLAKFYHKTGTYESLDELKSHYLDMIKQCKSE